MVFGETPREEEKVPNPEDSTNIDRQSVPAPERLVLLPEAMAALDAKRAREAQETKEVEKSFDHEAEKAAQEARYLKLNNLIKDVFRIGDGAEGDLTQHSDFEDAINNWKNIEKKRSDGMSEVEIERYFQGGKVELARRANLLANARNDIKNKLEVIEAKKAEQDLIGDKADSEKFDQEIASI